MVWNSFIQKVIFLLIIGFLAPLVQASDINIARTAFSSSIERHEPVNKLNTIQYSNQKIYFFTEVKNAHGKKITHQWLHNGWVTQSVTLAIKSNKWRTYSSKSFHPGTPKGTWTARVLDESGNIITESAIDYLGKVATTSQVVPVKTLTDKAKRNDAEQKAVKKHKPREKSQPKLVKPKETKEKTVEPVKKALKEVAKPTAKTLSKKTETAQKEIPPSKSASNSPTKKPATPAIAQNVVGSEDDCDAEDDDEADNQIVSGLEKNLIK
jgi:hypothetical protein